MRRQFQITIHHSLLQSNKSSFIDTTTYPQEDISTNSESDSFHIQLGSSPSIPTDSRIPKQRTNDYADIILEKHADAESKASSHRLEIYKSTTNHLDQNDVLDSILYLLLVLHDWMDKNQIDYFLYFGTLLGQHRGHVIIEYDYDADIGMLNTEFNKMKHLLLSNKSSINCLECAMVFRTGKHSDIIGAKFANKSNGIYVDIILVYERTTVELTQTITCFWPYYPGGKFSLPYNAYFPVQNCTMGHYDTDDIYNLRCVNKPAVVLQKIFGNNWTYPIPRGSQKFIRRRRRSKKRSFRPLLN